MQYPEYELSVSGSEAQHLLAPMAASRYDEMSVAANRLLSVLATTQLRPVVKMAVAAAEVAAPQPVSMPAETDPTLAALSERAASLALSAADTIVER